MAYHFGSMQRRSSANFLLGDHVTRGKPQIVVRKTISAANILIIAALGGFAWLPFLAIPIGY